MKDDEHQQNDDQNQNRKRVSARRRMEATSKPAPPPENILQFPLKTSSPGQAVLPVGRVSTQDQWDGGNAHDQTTYLTKVAIERGFAVPETFEICRSGKDLYWLPQMIAMSERYDATPLFTELDRIFRPLAYRVSSKEGEFSNEDAPYSRLDWSQLKLIIDGTKILVDLPPDATHEERASSSKRRGQAAKGNRGGAFKQLRLKEKKSDRNAIRRSRINGFAGCCRNEKVANFGSAAYGSTLG